MKILKLAVWAPVLALAACAQQPLQPGDAQPEQPAAQAPAPAPKPRVAVRPPAKPRVLPNQDLSPAVLFKLLLAEIA
ncbi:MAG: hypothetical protein AAB298_06585, partial [Pseudomonadota bacterium]